MKKLLGLSFAFFISISLFAQKQKPKNEKATTSKEEARNVVLGQPKENTGNSKQESKNVILGQPKEKAGKNTDVIWDGTKDHDGGGPKPSKNQPAKVRSAFGKDYPNATNVSWSKYRGDWTATFNSGVQRSVAVYHANGQRKDTRTVVQKTQLPKVILDDIFKKRPQAQVNDVVKIEVPQAVRNIFRVKTIESGTPRFNFYDANGKQVNYDY